MVEVERKFLLSEMRKIRILYIQLRTSLESLIPLVPSFMCFILIFGFKRFGLCHIFSEYHFNGLSWSHSHK